MMGSSTIQYELEPGRVIRSRAITSADKNTTAQILSIPAKTYVKRVWLIILTAFEGGVPSIDIGDGDDADGWIDTGDITEGTTGAYAGDETTTAAYTQTGRYYANADTIDAVVADGLTAGKAYVFAEVIDLADVIGD